MMDRVKVKAMQADIQEALALVARKHGMTVKAGGGTFDVLGSYKPHVEFRVEDYDRIFWVNKSTQIGFNPSDFGKAFMAGGHRYEICGLSPTLKVLGKRANGDVFTFGDRSLVREAIKLEQERHQ